MNQELGNRDGMKGYLKSVHIFALIFGGFSTLAALITILTLAQFLMAPEKLENRPPGTMVGVIITSIIFAGSAFAGLGSFFMRKSARGRTLGLFFGGILCLNILWVPLALVPGYKILTIIPVIMAVIGVWSVLVLIHPDTTAAYQAANEEPGPKATDNSGAKAPAESVEANQ